MKAKLRKKGILSTSFALLIMTFASLPGILGSTFNLEVQIAETYKEIQAGEETWFTAKILNLAGTQRMDITLKYEIKDEKSEVISSKTETVAIETQASFVANLKIPNNTPNGEYTLEVRVLANDTEEATAKESFKIVKENKKSNGWGIAIAILAFAAFTCAYAIFASKKALEKITIKKRIREIIKKRKEEGQI